MSIVLAGLDIARRCLCRMTYGGTACLFRIIAGERDSKQEIAGKAPATGSQWSKSRTAGWLAASLDA